MTQPLLDLLSRLAGDRRGATAVWFGVAALMLAVLVFGAIDVSRAMAEKTRLQGALDAATLMAARAGDMTPDALQAYGEQAMRAQLEGASGDARGVTASFTFGPDGAVVGTARGTLDPIIIGLFLDDKLLVGAETTVRRGQSTAVEMVLVVDTTGSMAGSKLTALKTAARKLVDVMSTDPDADVKLGLVPFGQYVNTGVSRRNMPWMNVPADYTETVTPARYKTTTTKTCQKRTYSCTRYNDGAPYQTTCTEEYNCVTTPVVPAKTVCPASYQVKHVYHGCTGSPAYPANVRDSDPARRYPGFLDLTCGSELTPLTRNFGQIRSGISSLKANGLTYIPAGLAWGFNLLSPAQPFTEGAAYDPSNRKPRKALVLMTDGENTRLMNPANGRHDKAPNGVATQANDYTAELCRNIKAQNIEIYTVAFQVTDAKIKSILKGCASSEANYYDASSAGDLVTAFEQIALSMRSLYISK
ncbi:MAG: vWA domain-containing protein [Caulobacter sp.]